MPAVLVDCFCSQPQYLRHLAPVWEALPAENRGLFVLPDVFAHRVGFPTVSSVPRQGDVLLVAAMRDFSKDRHQYQVHLEHGVGQTYSGVPGEQSYQHPAYPGGHKRGRVDLFLCPSQRVADLEGAKAVVVGAPKLDRYARRQELPAPNGSAAREGRVVALTWHWDASGISSEAGTAWWEYKTELHKLKDHGWEILGHAHPRIEQNTTPVYERAGIEVVTDFDEIIRRADVLCLDNSSAGPEFAAATGKPLVWINAKAYRRDVEHGCRFWAWPDGQVQCDRPEGLVAAIEFALEDLTPIQIARREMVADAYSVLDGRAAERAVAAVLERTV